jgi:hypothetical protein
VNQHGRVEEEEIMADKELTDTDMDPVDPKGVGESENRRGEDVIKKEGPEPGRHPNQGKSGADRPYGTSDARAGTGVDAQDPIDPDSPNVQPA